MNSATRAFVVVTIATAVTFVARPSTGAAATPAAISVTILHTNDLHSHFRGENTPLGLGGVARLKTAISKLRSQVPHSLLVDGGDWSEGNIYYNEGAGRETLRMMDHLGYDVAVVGNHDWLNGAEMLLHAIDEANPALKLIASNVETSQYGREAEFRRRIPPYVIRDVGGARIAFIGLLTYEFVYDKFLKPIAITEPFATTRELAHQLKKQVDAVIVISHNSISLNQGVLKAAPDVDLLIGAHDHVKLTSPVIVERPGAKPAWIVETGCWGRYLGRVDLKITPRDPSVAGSQGNVELLTYRLQQMDASVKEDSETLSRIATLEALIEAKRGPIFHDHIGDTEVELSRDGQENLMGDFATDAYLAATGADFALDQTNFIYNEIHQGSVRTVDAFNSNPGVYDPRTDKAWTLNVLPMPGKTLNWVLGLLYSTKAFSQGAALIFSGVDVVYDPILAARDAQTALASHALPIGGIIPASLLEAFRSANPDSATALGPIQRLKIRGQDVDPNRTYWVAASGGIVQALQFLDGLIPGAVPIDQMRDTGQEDWRAIADALRARATLKASDVAYGRVHTAQADLGLLYDDIRWEPTGHRDATGHIDAKIRVRVRNNGMTTSPAGTLTGGPKLEILINNRGVDFAQDVQFRNAGSALPLPELAPGQLAELSWEHVQLVDTLGVYALTARISGNPTEANHSNDEVTRYFTQPIEGARPTLHHPAPGL